MKKFGIIIMSIIIMSLFTSCDKSFRTADYMVVNNTDTFHISTLDEKDQVMINYDFSIELKDGKLVFHAEDDTITLDRANGEWITSYIRSEDPIMLHITDENFNKLYKYHI